MSPASTEQTHATPTAQPVPPPRFQGAIDILGIVLLFFVALVPLLALDITFHDGIESINVATAMELRRDGNWAMPHLLGEVRWAKAPLTTWITAGALRLPSMAALGGSDPVAAQSALRSVAFEARWPAALASCLMLAVIYELGRTITGRRLGLAAAMVAGTSMLFLRHSHLATIDAQLALCVAAVYMFLARAFFLQKWWSGLVGAGLALGLGLMLKGPVVLLQTVVPVLLFLPLWSRHQRAALQVSAVRSGRKWIAPLLVGIFLALLIGGWWYALMAYSYPEVLTLWTNQLFRPHVNDNTSPDKWFTYILALQQLMPWLPLVVAGGVAATVALWRRQLGPMTLILLWAVVPVLLMTLDSAKRERYLFPMLGPAALLAAAVLTGETAISLSKQARARLLAAHWIILVAVSVGYPASLVVPAMLDAHLPEIPLRFALAAGLAALVSVLICLRLSRHWRWAVFAATGVTMLSSASLYWVAEDLSPANHGPMEAAATAIRQQSPDALLSIMHDRSNLLLLNIPANKLSIYLNRTITCVDAWPAPAAEHRPTILLCQTPRGSQAISPPAGWQEFWQAMDRRNQWRLYRQVP